MSAELAAQLREQARQLEEAAKLESLRLPTLKSITSQTQPPPQLPHPGNLQVLVQQEVARQLAEAKPIAQPAPAAKTDEMLMLLLSQSIKPEEMEWVSQHIKEGGPGFLEFLKSDTIKAIMQMGFEAYKEFLAGQRQ